MQTIQMHLSQKQKKISEFFCEFFKSILYFEHFRRKMTLIANVFSKLRALKKVVK